MYQAQIVKFSSAKTTEQIDKINQFYKEGGTYAEFKKKVKSEMAINAAHLKTEYTTFQKTILKYEDLYIYYFLSSIKLKLINQRNEILIKNNSFIQILCVVNTTERKISNSSENACKYTVECH